jgi:hypothetical protein
MAGQQKWWKRSPIHPNRVEIVANSDFVPMLDAKAELGIGTGWISMLGHCDYIQIAALHRQPWYTDDLGVTRSSLDAERPRWRSASRARRAWLRFLLVFVSGGIGRLPGPPKPS